jgi:hypothetical protein
MPILPAAPWPEYRATVTGCRRVLVVAHTVPSATQLLRVVPLLKSDRRVQIHFTMAPDDFGDGVDDVLRELGVRPVPWEVAAKAPYQLAVAASLGELHKVHAPIVTLPHGAGHHKLVPAKPGGGPPATQEVYGFDRPRIIRDGRFMPTKIALSHTDQLAQLEESCPGASQAGVGAVVGDPIHDQIVAGLPDRAHYRRALGLRDRQRLVVVSSTWGAHSLFNQYEMLLPRLLSELPRDSYQVIAVLHPNIQVEHSRFQIDLWLDGCRRMGLRVVEPHDDWQAAVIAADWAVGDHGSVTLYATLATAPVLLATFPGLAVAPGSPPAALAEIAPRLGLGRLDPPIEAQLHAVATASAATALVGRRITTEPGRFARNLRRLLYGILELPEPPWPAELPPIRIPRCT